MSIAAQFLSIFFKILHIWVYSYNGTGIVVFDFFSQACEVISHLIVSILFILMASGWSIKYREFPDADTYIPIVLLVVLVNLMVVGLGRITNDSYYKFSDFEGIPGYIVVIIRISLWFWFYYSITTTYTDSKGMLNSFIFQFTILVSVYFLSVPGLVLFSWIFSPYIRVKVITIGTNLI